MKRIGSFGVLLLLALASSGFAPPAAQRTVAVPVILDGARYEAAVFNRLHEGLSLQFVLLQPDLLYAFRSVDEVRAFIAARSRTSSTVGGKLVRPMNGPAKSHLGSCQGHDHPYYSRFFEHTQCGGGYIETYPYSGIPDLRDPCPGCGNWNDRISSVACSAGPDTYYCTLWEHINYGGEAIWILHGTGVGNLGAYGFNDRASSLIVYTWPS